MKSYISRKLPQETRNTAMAGDLRGTIDGTRRKGAGENAYSTLFVRDFQDAAQRVAGDQEFFVGGDYPNRDLRAADIARIPAVSLIHLAVECDSEVVKTFANPGPNRARVLANAAGENQRVRAVHRG